MSVSCPFTTAGTALLHFQSLHTRERIRHCTCTRLFYSYIRRKFLCSVGSSTLLCFHAAKKCRLPQITNAEFLDSPLPNAEYSANEEIQYQCSLGYTFPTGAMITGIVRRLRCSSDLIWIHTQPAQSGIVHCLQGEHSS